MFRAKKEIIFLFCILLICGCQKPEIVSGVVESISYTPRTYMQSDSHTIIVFTNKNIQEIEGYHYFKIGQFVTCEYDNRGSRYNCY
jgi:hypothetical protein